MATKKKKNQFADGQRLEAVHSGWRRWGQEGITTVAVQSVSHSWLFATLWTIAHQAPLIMGFSRQEYWGGLPFPSPITTVAHTSSLWKGSFRRWRRVSFEAPGLWASHLSPAASQAWIWSLYLHKLLWLAQMYHYPHFTDKETEAQKG